MLKNNLKECRLRRKLGPITKSRLAHKLKISRSYITLLEKGKRKPSTELLFRMSKVLGCSVTEIYEYVPFDQEPKD